MIALIRLSLQRGRKPLACSSTNAATNNLTNRFVARDPDEQYLTVRLHPEHLEVGEVLRYDPTKGIPTNFGSLKKAKRVKKFGWENSVARTILKLARCIETQNPELLEMRPRYSTLTDILQIPWCDRSDEDKNTLRRMINFAAEDILKNANVVFTTCITATCK